MIRCPSPLIVAALVLFAASPRARAQEDIVTITAAEFQRMVYSTHLLTVLDGKPELDASLQVLLELHRRNPNADPDLLAGVVREATARYRTNAPSHIRTHGSRDEILAAYLDALRQVPARTNFVPADLALLNWLITRAPAPTDEPQADLIHSGSQGMLAAEGGLERRRLLLDAAMDRAGGHAAFAAALDDLLVPETLFSVSDPPAAIIGNTNSALHDNLTMQTLLAFSINSGNGSLTVSSNQLISLFSAETETLWETIHTNLALQAEFNQSQPDLLAYLTNHAAQAAWSQRAASVWQGQSRRIASSTAAILMHARLLDAKGPGFKVPKEIRHAVSALNNIGNSIATGVGLGIETGGVGAVLGLSGVAAGCLDIVDMISGEESPEEAIVREIAKTQTLIRNLSANINYRFDRVDRSLTQIYRTLNERFDQIEITLDAQGRQIAILHGNVNDIRHSLLDAQTDLFRVERNLATFHALDWRFDLLEDMSLALGYELRVGTPMAYDLYVPSYVGMENVFYTHAYHRAASETLSRYTTLPFGDEYFYAQLSTVGTTNNVYAEVLNYIKKCLRQRLGLAGFAEAPILVNPQDWSAGASAWLQLGVENPGYFRNYERDVGYPSRLDGIISKGRELTNFFGSLTFTGTNINWPLYTALENYHAGKLTNFLTQVSATEQQYASAHGFALNTWRQWSANAPRLAATTTEVLAAPPRLPPIPPIPRDATDIAAGGAHSLALRRNGTVLAWGRNDAGQSTVPATATNVAALSAGMSHSLALNSNGVVIAWGSDTYGQTNAPAEATNGLAVAAGHYHSLVLRADGTVVGWGAGRRGTAGFPHFGQATVPDDATNLIAVAAGGYHSLALRADGIPCGWGLNNEGQLNFPESATNVIAIVAGHGHNLALKSDGTLVAWGNNLFGSTDVPIEATNIVAIAAAGWHCLAQRADGKVFGWGRNDFGQAAVPFHSGSVQKLAAGYLHSLGLKADGTVLGWGSNNERQSFVPPVLSRHGAIAEGSDFNLALRTDGTVVGGGRNGYGQITIPASATNVVELAAGSGHGLALRADGTVVGWGRNDYGQRSIPPSATNVVAIAAGGYHSLVLRADGTVVGWGRNDYGQRSIPSSATNVVALAAGVYHSLALRGDRTVVGWGAGGPGTPPVSPHWGQTTIPITATNVVAIAAGSGHSLALRANDTVVGWGWNSSGQRSIPSLATTVVAIAAGSEHSLALRANGTVIGWGRNSTGEATGVPTVFGAVGVVTLEGRLLTNVVAVAAGSGHSLALQADGTFVGWGTFDYGQTAIPPGATNWVAIAAGAQHSLTLRADGTVVGWGSNDRGQTSIPASVTDGVAIAAGDYHSLVLRADGTVVAWGSGTQTNVPPGLANMVAIAAGGEHSLALWADGTVVGWGHNGFGQANSPPIATNVVAIAAGRQHFSLALRADGTVVGWGNNSSGEATGVPTVDAPAAGVVTLQGQLLTDVVGVAAGYAHSLALQADGTVVGWGNNSSGQTSIPSSATNVVAIAAGYDHSLALRADGTVVGWGWNGHDQTTIPASATNVVAIAAGAYHSLFLKASAIAGAAGAEGISFVRAGIPDRVGSLLQNCNQNTLVEFSRVGLLQAAGTELSGARTLFTAVLELAMPYTLERDDVLHGFLYGHESLIDLAASGTFLVDENDKLEAAPDAAPQNLAEVAVLRYLRFRDRLEARLNDLAATGQPELPRLVEHTLRLMSLLRDAWPSVPPPALEIGRGTNAVGVLLYGEPYARYTLQYRDNLSVPGWTPTTITNLHNEEVVTLPVSGPHRFYRAMLPVP